MKIDTLGTLVLVHVAEYSYWFPNQVLPTTLFVIWIFVLLQLIVLPVEFFDQLIWCPDISTQTIWHFDLSGRVFFQRDVIYSWKRVQTWAKK